MTDRVALRRWQASVSLVLCMLVMFCGAVTAQSTSPRIIADDRGGSIGVRVQEVAQINANDTRVELRGRICYSSCTLYLGAADVCVSPTTTFGFHGPSDHGAALTTAAFDHWSGIMAAHYNPPLRQWFMQQARHRRAGFHRLTGQQLIAIGYSPCP